MKKHREVISISLSLLFGAAIFAVSVGFLAQVDFQLNRLSFLKAGGVITLNFVAVYFTVSCVSISLLNFNRILLTNLILFIVLFEISSRLLEEYLPNEIVMMLPEEHSRRILGNRGSMTTDNIVGENMLYSFLPNTEIKAMPWLAIDSKGYRKSRLSDVYDVVLLGDSVTIAQNSRRDLGDLIRQAGFEAINLGFGGYGPYQYRDAYRKYIIDRNIQHRAVLINFCACNDVENSIAYKRVFEGGKDWKYYLSRTPTKQAFPFNFSPPWSISIGFNLPFWVVQKFRNYQTTMKKDIAPKVKLPRGTIKAVGWVLEAKPKYIAEQTWQIVFKPLREIARLANVAGAQVVFGYYPDLAQLYAPYMPQGIPQRAAAEINYRDATTKLQALAIEIGAEFIDYTGAMQKMNGRQLATTKNSDYHPNLLGVETMSRSVIELLKKSS